MKIIHEKIHEKHQHPASIHYIIYIYIFIMKNKTKTHQETEKTIYQKHSNHEKRYEKIHENRRFSFRPFEAMISISCEEVTKEPCNEFRGVE